MLVHLLVPLALAPQEPPLPALEFLAPPSPGETVLVFVGEAVLSDLLAPLDEALDLRRAVFDGEGGETARLRAAWNLGPGGFVAILDAPGATRDAIVPAADFPRTFLERVVRPRLDATLPPEGVRLVEGDGVALLIAWKSSASAGASSRVDLTARWLGPAPGPRHEPHEARDSCDVPADLPLVRRGLRVSQRVFGRAPIPDLHLLADRSGPALAPAEEALEVAVRDGRFEPWVSVVPAGSTVRIENHDRCAHVVHVKARRNMTYNSSLPPGHVVAQVFRRPEIVRVVDDVHPWMEAWLVVTDSPHVSATDADGRAGLEAPPVGLSGLRLWHPDPRVGRATLPLDVLPGDDLRVWAWLLAD